MLFEPDHERLSREVLLASYESVTLADLGTRVLPLVDRLFATSTSVVHRWSKGGELVPVAGGFVAGSWRYVEQYMAMDPMQRVLSQQNPWILHASRHAEWKEFLRLPVYTDHARRYGLDTYLHVRLNDARYGEEGMVGMLLGRSARQPEFTERDCLRMAGLLPALEALVRRSARVDEQLRTQEVVESIADTEARPVVALDPNGALLWASRSAHDVLRLQRGGRRVVPDALVGAAHRLGALLGKELAVSTEAPPSTVTLGGGGATPVRATLRLARTRSGVAYVLAELEVADGSSARAVLAERYELTAAEAEVLALLAEGLSDREIGAELFVSVPTVRTHVGRILGKLGVKSRTQAALVAHGIACRRGTRRGRAT